MSLPEAVFRVALNDACGIFELSEISFATTRELRNKIFEKIRDGRQYIKNRGISDKNNYYTKFYFKLKKKNLNIVK